jgi:hypothetical protein
LIQNQKTFNCKDLARCGQHRLWPLLHVVAKASEAGGEKKKALAKAQREGEGREEGTGAFVSAALNQRGEDWAGVGPNNALACKPQRPGSNG